MSSFNMDDEIFKYESEATCAGLTGATLTACQSKTPTLVKPLTTVGTPPPQFNLSPQARSAPPSASPVYNPKYARTPSIPAVEKRKIKQQKTPRVSPSVTSPTPIVEPPKPPQKSVLDNMMDHFFTALNELIDAFVHPKPVFHPEPHLDPAEIQKTVVEGIK